MIIRMFHKLKLQQSLFYICSTQLSNKTTCGLTVITSFFIAGNEHTAFSSVSIEFCSVSNPAWLLVYDSISLLLNFHEDHCSGFIYRYYDLVSSYNFFHCNPLNCIIILNIPSLKFSFIRNLIFFIASIFLYWSHELRS